MVEETPRQKKNRTYREWQDAQDRLRRKHEEIEQMWEDFDAARGALGWPNVPPNREADYDRLKAELWTKRARLIQEADDLEEEAREKYEKYKEARDAFWEDLNRRLGLDQVKC